MVAAHFRIYEPAPTGGGGLGELLTIPFVDSRFAPTVESRLRTSVADEAFTKMSTTRATEEIYFPSAGH